MILCVSANPSIDRLFAVDRLLPGTIHRPADFVQTPGGKGLNVARAAAVLGGDVHAAALLGGHAGRWIAQELETERIDLHATWAARETRSSLSVSGALEGLTEFYEHGAAVSAAEWDEFGALVAEVAPQASWMTLSGSLPTGAPEDGYVSLVGLTRTALDSEQPGIDARPDLVKVNRPEAAALTGCAQPADAAAEIHRRTGGIAIVTRGREGAVMVASDGRVVEGTLDADGPYPVGSGDAFLAGLVVALDRGAGWESALKAALGSGAANAEQPGAARLERSRAEQLAGRAHVRELP